MNRVVGIVVGAVFAFLFLRWQLLDRTPPTWDEGIYLIDTFVEWDALHRGGVVALYRAFLSVDPGRVGLLPLMGVPGFAIAGPSAKAAIMPFAGLWIIAIVSIFDFTARSGEHLFGLDRHRAQLGALFACLLFATYPLTQFVSLGYYVEFPLLTAIAALNASALRYWLTGRPSWALAVGIALALGLLCKVTFPAFVLAGVGLVVWRFAIDSTPLRSLRDLSIIALPVLLIAAPVYLVNARAIIDLTAFLSSANVASVYGFNPALDPSAIIRFFGDLLNIYEFLLCALLAAAALIWVTVSKCRRPKLAAALIFTSVAVPLAIVALSSFKLERYAHPGFIGLFVLAGLGLSLPLRWPWLGAPLSIVLLLLPIVKTAATYAVLPEWALSPLASVQGRLHDFRIASYYIRPPDSRDWHIADLTAATARLPGPIIILGGSAAFHQALLQFASLASGGHQEFQGFVYQLYPNFIDADMLRFLDEHRSSPVLYKSPPYPLFLGKGVIAGFDMLAKRNNLARVDLDFIQPDGSRFVLFVPSDDDHSDAKRLAAQRILSYSEIPKAAQNVGLRLSEQMKGYVDGIGRVNEREVIMTGWLMDPQGKTPLDVLVFVDGTMVAATRTKGERPDITTGFYLGSGAEKNVAFSVNVHCRPGDEPVVVGVGERKQYVPLLLYHFEKCP